jgi:hypothetical protein
MKKIFFVLFISLSIFNCIYPITIPDVSDTLYIGQILQIPIDLSDIKPEKIYIDRTPNKTKIEIFDIAEIQDKPWNYLIKIAPFDTGFVQTEKFSLFAVKNSVIDTFFVEPFNMYIKSSLTQADTLLKDISPPIKFYLKVWDYLFVLLVILLIFVAIYIFIKFKNKKNDSVIVEDLRPPCVIALEMLEIFYNKRLLERHLFLDYYFELSMIFRFFLERQYNIKAMEMTTFEIKKSLQEINEKREIINILNEMDKVKFAKSIPDYQSAENYYY